MKIGNTPTVKEDIYLKNVPCIGMKFIYIISVMHCLARHKMY